MTCRMQELCANVCEITGYNPALPALRHSGYKLLYELHLKYMLMALSMVYEVAPGAQREHAAGRSPFP